MAVTVLHNKLLKNIDEGYYTCCLFLDLSKAFDTGNHILHHKLHTYGIRGNMYDVLTSYLEYRKQFTKCNNTGSQADTVVCGVPQLLQHDVNQELQVIDQWIKCNRLSLNYKKTYFFISAANHNS